MVVHITLKRNWFPDLNCILHCVRTSTPFPSFLIRTYIEIYNDSLGEL